MKCFPKNVANYHFVCSESKEWLPKQEKYNSIYSRNNGKYSQPLSITEEKTTKIHKFMYVKIFETDPHLNIFRKYFPNNDKSSFTPYA